ncbi:SPO22-domain-containing protein [Lepidopterella palustris CBS 459.81]|uniref:SPO22-domain-containing protein n=1 Tax=Lepidopterella palustris CBS 459.81 TaxID=1314670 RepID=A0A8E2E5E4_9PEZI|nr:SPO22-domain-containing protein [Lepidopterella palustris CBS 459.81]
MLSKVTGSGSYLFPPSAFRLNLPPLKLHFPIAQMAPLNTARSEREKKLKLLLSFTKSVPDRITAIPRDPALSTELQAHIHTLPLSHSATATAKQEELDRAGTELWNLSTRLRRDESHNDKKLLCLLRVFAFLLLDSGHGQSGSLSTVKGMKQGCVRLLRVALKAAKFCLDQKQIELCLKVLERAAVFEDQLGKVGVPGSGVDGELRARLKAEYFVLRTALAWRQERMDIAEHMFSKSALVGNHLDPATAENLSDLLYEIGKDMLHKKNYEMAVKWLGRSHDVLGEQDLEKLSVDAGELRLSIMQSLVKAFMKLKNPDAEGKAWELVNLLETDYGDKMVVSLLKLELLSSAATIDADQYYSVLLRMIRSIVLTEVNFKTIMHHIHKLKDHNNATACKILDDLIVLCLFSAENQDWIEKATITRIWLSTKGPDSCNIVKSLQELFDAVSRGTKNPFGAPATHAAQTLLWKRIESAYSQAEYESTELWCRLSVHSLFDKAGEFNKAKIARKMILCALSRQEWSAARDIFFQMSDSGKAEAMTRYLMYKVSLRSGHADLAGECLDAVCHKSSKDATLLYACVLEAQKAGDRRQAIAALRKVLEKYGCSVPAGIHLPALLRCTTRLLVSELVTEGKLNQDIAEELCKVFEGAATQAKASRQRPATLAQQQFTTSEFEWFSKNSYNLSLKHCAELHPQKLTRLLNACAQFITLLKDQDQDEANDDLNLRLMFCDFLAACAFVTLARAEDNIQASLQHYLAVRRHSQSFRNIASEQLRSEKLGDSARVDLIAKHFQVIKFELEAILKLEVWNSMDDLFEECWKYENPHQYETLADLVLVIHSCIVKVDPAGKYQAKILAVLQKIINITWRHGGNDIVKLAHWIRCLFQIALSFDEKISLSCLDQATNMARKKQGEQNHYPTAELEWLATTSFNRGVDFYCASDDENSRVWAEKALVLASVAEDGGILRDLLMEKYSGLRWEAETA